MARGQTPGVAGRDASGLPSRRGSAEPFGPPATIHAMAERSAVERELEEIGTQLAWVRDYL
jgi:hypothetical protein